ncbi:uncharacterized protein LOC128964587 [Oppia nitens]|uniref:uncharacterized protein LOC128964587 n=1 Tax=Oppia nitens TaxID=1686743 RepID=UPI0023DA4E83|nr:uncharacterized protein LOC128964587 [Oppia nitens]
MSLIILLLFYIKESESIDCFKCTSNVGNGENRMCEDPFHNNYSSSILHSPCWAGRKNRNGIFPGTACIKLSGKFEDNGETMIVRDCALDSGSLTIDTEIVRMSHCGGFFFGDRYVRGCVQSCFEDACNNVDPNVDILFNNLSTFLMTTTIGLIMSMKINCLFI